MLISIIPIALLVVRTREIQRISNRVLDFRTDNRGFRPGTCHPTTTKIHRAAELAAWICGWSHRRYVSIACRIVVTDAQAKCSQRQRTRIRICWIDQCIEIAIKGQCSSIQRRIVVNPDR